MPQYPTLTYAPTANNRDYVAIAALAAPGNWTIVPAGSIDGNPNPINPNNVVVDNLTNPSNANITFGPYAWVVPAYSRKSFKLPVPTQLVTVTFTDPALNVYFVENPNFIADDQNFLAIQEAARGVALFPFVIYNAANSPQQTTDANSNVEFVGIGFDIIYTLLDILTDNVKNGWFQFIFNNGNKSVEITPFGGDTLNGIFNNALPFLLYPGEYGILTSDGTQWFARVFGQKLPSATETTFAVTMAPSDIFKRKVFTAGANQTYDLLAAATFTNGDRLRVKNSGANIIHIAPHGAETIGGIFTAAAPLNLYPLDEIELLIDDTGIWVADGEITFQSPGAAIAIAATGTIPHGMGRQPFSVTAWVRCLTANVGYTAGEEFLLGNCQSVSSDAAANHAFRIDATNIKYTLTQRSVFRLSDPATGIDTNITLADFEIFFRATARL